MKTKIHKFANLYNGILNQTENEITVRFGESYYTFQKPKEIEKYELEKLSEDYFNIKLSEEEQTKQFFNPYKLANTLDIKVEDAVLLLSKGNTYVYAEDSKGNLIELYHPSLYWNDFSISVTYGEKAKQRYKYFLENREQILNTPYSNMLGQTNNINHYVR